MCLETRRFLTFSAPDPSQDSEFSSATSPSPLTSSSQHPALQVKIQGLAGRCLPQSTAGRECADLSPGPSDFHPGSLQEYTRWRRASKGMGASPVYAARNKEGTVFSECPPPSARLGGVGWEPRPQSEGQAGTCGSILHILQ